MRSIPIDPNLGGGLRPRVGIDAVRLDRIARMDRSTVTRHICGAAELAALTRAASADPDAGLRRTAATWAIKEAAVKARGGRTDDFAWPAIRVTHDSGQASRVAQLAGAAIQDLAEGRSSGSCLYQWPESESDPGGVAAWGATDGLVLAIAINTPDGVSSGGYV